MNVKLYNPKQESVWNSFTAGSGNATFILDRRFLEYHKHQFRDNSLLLYDQKNLVSVFPGSESEDIIYSHGGLTYGGLLVKPNVSLLTTISCFYALSRYYHNHGYTKIIYKPVPTFFHTNPYYQDLYALFLLRATLTAMNTGFVTQLPAKISKRRMRLITKAQKHRIGIERANNCYSFWDKILVPHLASKFHTKPVHTFKEIEALRGRFPNNIIQYNALLNDMVIAGTTIFVDRGVAHSQYIASSELGRQTGALDYLFWHLLTKEFKSLRYFSFGTTNMGSVDGRELSRGLVEWKEGFGAHTVLYPCYTIETKNYIYLNNTNG